MTTTVTLSTPTLRPWWTDDTRPVHVNATAAPSPPPPGPAGAADTGR